MAVNIEDFDGILMSKLFPQAWPQMKLHLPVKEKAGDKTGPTSNSESSSPELFSLQEERPEDKPEQNLVPAKREGLSEMLTPESTSFKLTEVEDKPATAHSETLTDGNTFTRN